MKRLHENLWQYNHSWRFQQDCWKSSTKWFHAITRHAPPYHEPTCFQSHDPTCINNILRNQKTMFKTSKTFESGLSDHHKLVSTITKPCGFRDPPRKNVCRFYKNFGFACFNTALKTKLDSIGHWQDTRV